MDEPTLCAAYRTIVTVTGSVHRSEDARSFTNDGSGEDRENLPVSVNVSWGCVMPFSQGFLPAIYVASIQVHNAPRSLPLAQPDEDVAFTRRVPEHGYASSVLVQLLI